MFGMYTVRAILPDGCEYPIRWQVMAQSMRDARDFVRNTSALPEVRSGGWPLKSYSSAVLPAPYRLESDCWNALYNWKIWRTAGNTVLRQSDGYRYRSEAEAMHAAADALADHMTRLLANAGRLT